ncbi:transcriptional regulator [Azonexus caeni]|jgi:DNA-binding transcriptional regulator YdaS (Cro superfamily)|uniref:transcriptional regulator n=1 Tax=Azonexus caeni TaxID=266126 RepID=UPI003A8B4012
MDLHTYLESQALPAGNFAAKLKVPPSLLSQWRTGVRRVPAERCPDIERESGGIVTCEELRPDVDWAYLRQPLQRVQEAA